MHVTEYEQLGLLIFAMQKFKGFQNNTSPLSHCLTYFFQSGVQKRINSFWFTLTFISKEIEDLLLILKPV